MPTPQYMTYPESIEPLVQFIEDTLAERDPRPRARQAARRALPIQEMLTASALAVTRSTEMPPGHHGGPLHPLAGLYAVTKLVERLEGEEQFCPGAAARRAQQQAHPPSGDGPLPLPEFAPLNGGGVEAVEAGLPDGGGSRRVEQGRPPVPVAVEERAGDRGFDLLLSVGDPEKLPRRPLLHVPEHAVAGDRQGRSRRAVHAAVMRPAVRYVTRYPVAPPNPIPSPFPQIDALIEEHQLLKRVLPAAHRRRRDRGDRRARRSHRPGRGVFRHPGADRQGAWRTGCRSRAPARRCRSAPPVCSCARSAATRWMSTCTPASIMRRYLMRLDGISLKNKLMLLLTWHSGPEIRSTANRMQPPGAARQAKSPPCRRAARKSCSTRSSRASTTSRRPTGRRSPISA